MPMTESTPELMPVRSVAGQACSCSMPGWTFSLIPSQPPARFRPTTVNGVRNATITKNCRTSL